MFLILWQRGDFDLQEYYLLLLSWGNEGQGCIPFASSGDSLILCTIFEIDELREGQFQ
jgi:hypothetical protein